MKAQADKMRLMTLKLPDPLRERCQAAARTAGVSTAEWIRTAIELRLRTEPKERK